MSISLDSTTFSKCKHATVHKLPCSIYHDGEVKCESFFESTIRKDENVSGKGKSATFRGRPLNGCYIGVPSGFEGIVMKESRKPFAEEEERTFHITHKFDKLTAWNLNKECTANDEITQALKWISVSKLIHSHDEETR